MAMAHLIPKTRLGSLFILNQGINRVPYTGSSVSHLDFEVVQLRCEDSYPS